MRAWEIAVGYLPLLNPAIRKICLQGYADLLLRFSIFENFKPFDDSLKIAVHFHQIQISTNIANRQAETGTYSSVSV